jgi:ubiquinone/menaquinone biosynthesis C-methylase UbiE
MGETSRHDAWQAGESYDLYMGRWSRRVAPRFLEWLDPADGLDWVEVGCGTGALSAAIVSACNPKSLLSIDQSKGFLAQAGKNVTDRRVSFRMGDAQALPADDESADIVVSSLVLNFVPDRHKALHEMARVARAGAMVAFYVWDYPGGGVEFMRAFWNVAVSLDPKAKDLTEDQRFPFCTREGLVQLAREAGFLSVDSTIIETPTVFKDFDDYWKPFTLGAGPAPGYCVSLDPAAREHLREKLLATLPRADDASIPLKVRAWAVRAVVP